jgi:hypothetical protein
MRWVREHSAEITITTFVIALGAGVYIYAHRDVGSLEESKQRGAVIVAALERYRAERGNYPDSLPMLVPAYAPAIAQPSWGLQQWRYRRYTSADVAAQSASDSTTVYFQLSVAANPNGYPVLYYDLIARRWVLNN